MISCSVTIYPVIKAKPVSYPDLVCQPDAISVDSNNVQAQPLRIRPLNRIGGQVEAMKAYIRVSVKSGDMELGRAESGAPLSEWDYSLPSDKWGEADNVVVTTYEDPRYVTRLAEKQVSILRQHATPFPVEGGWRPLPFKYKNGEYFVDNERNLVFQWMNPVPGNSDVHPFEDIKNNPNTTSWKQHTEWVLLATQVFLANFAKLGSAVFSGDYMMSQHGKDAAGADTVDYRKFDESQIGKPECAFAPNILLNMLSGMAMFANGNAKFNPDGTVEVKGRFEAEDEVEKTRIVIDPQNSGMKMYAAKENEPVADLSFAKDYDGVAYPNLKMRVRNERYKRKFDISVDPRAIVMSDEYSNGERKELYLNASGITLPAKADVSIPGVLYCGHFGSNGIMQHYWGNKAGIVRCEMIGGNAYRVTHGVNSMNYFVSIIPVASSFWAYASLQGKNPGVFDFIIADPNKGSQRTAFDLVIYGEGAGV